MSDFMLKINISISTIQIFLIKNFLSLILLSFLIILWVSPTAYSKTISYMSLLKYPSTL